MFHPDPMYVASSLLRMAESEFPNLMDHETNREDALQVLRLVQWQRRGASAARRALAQLELDLGVRIPEVALDARLVA